MSDGRRVVVTGMSAITPIGATTEAFWSALLAGQSGIRPIQSFDASRVTSRIAGEALDFDPSIVLDRKEIKRNDRTTQMTLVVTRAAMDDAGLPERFDEDEAEMTGIIVGSGLGGTGTLIDQISLNATRGPDRLSPFFIPMAIGNIASGVAAMQFNAKGPNFAAVSACASGGHAIGEASEMIRRGDADVMLATGAEATVYEATVGGFAAMRALSTRNDDPAGASRPFDSGRDGFVLAEGAACLVLEALEHAKARGARILAELCGYGATADASHITLPAPGGNGAMRAGRRALAKAGIAPSEIDLVAAHATSTPGGDMEELAAIRTLLGDHAPKASVTALKSSIGHTLGAAGAIASVATILAMRDGIVPGTLNLTDPDPGVGEMDLTPLTPRRREVRTAVVNAFGFGGQNSALVLRRWDA
ncbi:MAG: beta-ketoacyl-ACP synthase II [Chloroflexota bacterium]